MEPANTTNTMLHTSPTNIDKINSEEATGTAPLPSFALLPNLKFALAGVLFGILLVKAEVISWFRIQEMFRLQSFHMYGVIGSAVATGILSIWLIKKFNLRSIAGERIIIAPKNFDKGQVYGGLLFGFGWALTGACPGPLFAQIGSGATVIVVTLASAVAGTWVYGYVKEKLPH